MVTTQINYNHIKDYVDGIPDSFGKLSDDILFYMNSNQIEITLLEKLTTKLLKKYDDGKITITKDKISLVLEYMIKNNIFSKDEYGVVHTCPSCNSYIKHAECHDCKPGKIVIEQKILHTKCGYIGDLNHFVNRGGLFCPQCGDMSHYLSDSKSNEFRFTDTIYRCKDCGKEFKLFKTKDRDYCDKCNNSFKTKHSKIYNLDIYKK